MSDLAKVVMGQTLFEMLKEKPYDEITVTSLIKECNISRSTFYYHFEDMGALLEWSTIHHFSRVLGSYKTYRTWPDGFLRILKEIYAEKDILLRVVDYVDRSALEEALYDPVYHLLYDVLQEQPQADSVSEDKKVFIADFYKFAFVGLVINWVKGGFRENPEQLADNLYHVMHGTFAHALEEYSHSDKRS